LIFINYFLLESDLSKYHKEKEAKTNRRKQSLRQKAIPRTPPNKQKQKSPQIGYKDSIPFEYQKESISGKKEEKSTPTRSSREVSPNLHFMSPTTSSKVKRSNKKKVQNRNKPNKLYTIEDLNGNKQKAK